MTKERCPFLGKLRDGNLSGCECVQEQCMFYRAEDAKCVFIEIGTASREYLESLKRMAEQNELTLMRERAASFSDSEKAERVQLYASQGGINKNQGNFEKALLDYKKALILMPKDHAIHRSLGDIYSIQGIMDEAISSYRQSLKEYPDDGETWIRLILQYRAISAHMPDQEKRYAGVIKKIQQELSEVKNEATVNAVLGNAYLILHSQDTEKFEEQRSEAQKLMQKALELDPKNIWAYLGLKDVRLYDNDYEGAINQLLEGMKHNPDNSRLSFELGECYLIAHAEHALSDEDCLNKAHDYYKKLLEQDPSYAPAYFRLGYISEQKASYDQAIEYYKQGLEINPINQFAHFRLGKIHLIMGMTELAISRFKEVIELSKNRIHEVYQEGYRFNKLRFFKEASALEAWIELGKILVRRRQYDDASEAFQKALTIDKSSPLAITNQIDLYKIRTADSKDVDTLYSKYIEQYKNAAMIDFQNPVAHYALAYACQVLPAILADKQEERTEEALNSYQMAINLKPDFKWAYWGLKNSYLTIMEDSTPLYEQALDACKVVTEFDSEDPRGYFETGDVYHRMGDTKQAICYFEKALEKDKTYIPAYLNMAEIEHDSGNQDETIKLYQKVIRINPNFAQGYYELGKVYQEIKENEKALSNLRKAIELDIDYTEAHFAIGQICYEEHQDETARIRFSRVIELEEDNADAHYYLGMIHHRNGHFKEAVEELDIAIRLSKDPIKMKFDLA
ncbi:MAG: tetratricopeptide repeat protein, partial [Candidatus Riflebacteria bacterium]|nr:tetratricopeptide repeat protein [Candidatus Riflebacteria bacterium]